MSGKRRRHTDEFKARVALEAVKGVRTLAELSSAYGLHPTVIAHWKRQLIGGAAGVFAAGAGKSESREDRTGPLYQEIGRLKMEVDWLKKKL
jgi:transposase